MKHLLPLHYIEAIARHGSIRKAADHLAITPSALNRRLMAMEDELEVPLFERLPKGVRPSAAGELLLEHIRNQISDLERVKSRIADLSGMRKGHVTVGCSPEISGGLLPDIVFRYQSNFPGVTFDVVTIEQDQIMDALSDHSIDVAIVYEPNKLAEFQTVFSLQQQIVCLIPQGHSLAERERLRLYECVAERAVIPAEGNGIRGQLENAAVRLGLKLDRSVQASSQSFRNALNGLGEHLSYDLPINRTGKVDHGHPLAVPLDQRDVPPGFIFVGHFRGRALPVAAARFMEDVVEALAALDFPGQ